MISFRHRWDPTEGHIISVRTPRLVTPGAPVFYMAGRGNIEGLQNIFKLKLASPFDVSSTSCQSVVHVSLLFHSIPHRKLRKLKFNVDIPRRELFFKKMFLREFVSSFEDRMIIILLQVHKSNSPSYSTISKMQELTRALVCCRFWTIRDLRIFTESIR